MPKSFAWSSTLGNSASHSVGTWCRPFRKAAITVSALCLLFIVAYPAGAVTVTIDTDSASAVLIALGNASLTREDALKIAYLRGNQGIIREMNSFHVPVTDLSFANALWAAAHDHTVTDLTERALYFDTMKPKALKLLALTNAIAADPSNFQKSIEKRIAMFTLPGLDTHLQGYIVAGGDGGGYGFGDTAFYLNLAFNDDLAAARTVTTHELYHAVQSAFAPKTVDVKALNTVDSDVQRACLDTAHLLANIYREGSAMLVEDASTLSLSRSDSAIRQLRDIDEGLAHLGESATLLELATIGLNTSASVRCEDVYAVGFLGHGVLYDIGYGMAKAIVNNDGPQGLAHFLNQPPYLFTMRYTELPTYGRDKDHPRLGPNTLHALQALADGCQQK